MSEGAEFSMLGIDVHSHVVPASFPRSVRSNVRSWPTMEPHDCDHRNIVIDGKAYRTLSDRCWRTEKRLEDMASMQIGLQVISPMPELFSYWLAAEDAAELLRYVNDQVALMAQEAKGRIVAFGAVPLQDMDLALRELERLHYELAFSGVEIGSNINGRSLGDPELEPFFQAAADFGMAVFVHAVRPTGMERIHGPRPLEQVLGYPTDVGLAVASIVCANTMVKFPGLRMAFSHGGGTFASLLPRFAEGFRCFSVVRDQLQLCPEEQARKLFFDTLVYDTSTLRHLAAEFGESQLLIGSDYPFNFHERKPVDKVREAFGGDLCTAQAVASRNAIRFLDLKDMTQ
jgi:aminocarboxymuconate-semialdehyde decarboxylase